MKPHIGIAIVIPAGPGEDILDTLASVIHYTESPRVVLVVNDSPTLSKHMRTIEDLSPDIVVIPAPPKAPGGDGGLWVKLSAGYRWILERYEPRIILRLDTDALLIGHGLGQCAEAAFAQSEAIGILGACRIGPDGGARDPSWAARELRTEAGLRGLLHPRCRSALRYFLELAHRNGYIAGESALGGAYIHSYQAASSLYQRGWLDQPWLASSRLGEDHIMSLLTVAAGYQLGEFGGPADPMALRWRGLPDHPAELLQRNKLITHSVRFWGSLSERQIRDIFAEARARDPANP